MEGRRRTSRKDARCAMTALLLWGKMSTRFVPRLRTSALVGLALVATSCADTEEGSAGPATSEAISTVESRGSERGVSDPLDVSPYLSKPCGLVSAEMLDELGTSLQESEPRLPENDKIAAQSGPYCSWSGEREGSISVAVASKNSERGMGGLRGLEALRDQGRFSLWDETSVSGYPAVYLGVTDDRARGDCDLAVGIADDMTFSVTAISFYDNPQRACEVASEVAADVIRTLKGGR